VSTLQSNIGRWADHVVLARQPQVDLQLIDEPEYGLFVLAFDNSKRRGKGKPTQSYECWGCCYPLTGHVVLDTLDMPVRDFGSMLQMREYLGKLGHYSVVWEGKGDE
jgi:hypothetical protein